MSVSAARLEANRRNAQKSTGPRTEEGKGRSKMNAVKDGMRAQTLVLLDEDPQMLEDRRAAWRASLNPANEVEENAVNAAVEFSWLQDRARRAQDARLAANRVNAGVEESTRAADRVLLLGQKLFSDNRAPLATYPHLDLSRVLRDQQDSTGLAVRPCRRAPGPPAPYLAPPVHGRRLPVDARPLVGVEIDPRGWLQLAITRQVQGRPAPGPPPDRGGRRSRGPPALRRVPEDRRP